MSRHMKGEGGREKEEGGSGRALVLLLFGVLLTGFHTPALAQDARQIVEEAQKRTISKSQRYEGLLQSFDSNGKSTNKRWIYERLGSHGASKVLIRFTAPGEVRGVALLVVNHPERSSDQWMWTPALERDRRIAMQDRSTRFFGTDFSFEDLEERDVNQHDYSLLREESIDGTPCWVVQSTPKRTKSSQYSRTIAWIRKDNYVYTRVDSYVKDDVVRQLDYGDIREVQGIWTAHHLTMNDLRRRTRTRLTLEKVQYDLPLKEDGFTIQALRR